VDEFREILAKDVRPGDRIKILTARAAKVGTVVAAEQTKVGLDSLPIRIVVDIDGERDEITRHPGVKVAVARAEG
jgi:hypothetical protein